MEELRKKLSEFDQLHLLDHLDSVTEDEKQRLLKELRELDLAEVMDYFERTVVSMNETAEKLDDKMAPLPPDQCGSVLKVRYLQ